MRTRLAPLLAGVLALCCPGIGLADERVQFRAAVAAGSGGQGTPLVGYLARPKTAGRSPAVVVLHSCLGLRADRGAIEQMLTGWGYVALLVDDFATRGLKETCSVDFPEGLADAVGALRFLAAQPGVDPGRIGALGYSQGADTALQLAAGRYPVAFGLIGGLGFRAAAAFYPPCQNQWGSRVALPTLIVVGAADSVTPAAACETFVTQSPGAPVELRVLAGAGHVFDDPAFAGGRQLLGMRLVYDAAAAARSRPLLHDFLARTLAK